jgi:hypothetical protein
MGFFYRTIRMVDHGIKPCYIFDGKPPELKGGVVSWVGPGRVGSGRVEAGSLVLFLSPSLSSSSPDVVAFVRSGAEDDPFAACAV